MKTNCPKCKKKGKPANMMMGSVAGCELSLLCENNKCDTGYFGSNVFLTDEELKNWKKLGYNYGSKKLKKLMRFS